jgi:hypothetical protein
MLINSNHSLKKPIKRYLKETPEYLIGMSGASVVQEAKQIIIEQPNKFLDLWADLFSRVFTREDLQSWEYTLSTMSCTCNKLYHKWKAKNPPPEKLDLEWKWRLKGAVNKKLKKPDITLTDAEWLYRFCGDRGNVHNWITNQDLVKDTQFLTRLIYSHHPKLSGVAGVARSGMLPATQIALALGVDLYEATTDGCKLISGGVRRTGTLHGERRNDNGPIVIVDDSTCSGYARDRFKHMPNPFYTVYAGGEGKAKLDGYVVPLELPHFFEWNLTHNGIIINKCKSAFDLDGVFCEDCPITCDDDGRRYIEWMNRVQPLQWNIEYEVYLIVTARREPYRKLTMKWLDKYGIRVKHLEMFPGTFEERARTNIGQWKAEVAKKYGAGHFIESSYHQAVEIQRCYPNCLVVSIERKPNDYINASRT